MGFPRVVPVLTTQGLHWDRGNFRPLPAGLPITPPGSVHPQAPRKGESPFSLPAIVQPWSVLASLPAPVRPHQLPSPTAPALTHEDGCLAGSPPPPASSRLHSGPRRRKLQGPGRLTPVTAAAAHAQAGVRAGAAPAIALRCRDSFPSVLLGSSTPCPQGEGGSRDRRPPYTRLGAGSSPALGSPGAARGAVGTCPGPAWEPGHAVHPGMSPHGGAGS